jgi:peptidyl-prolyl cis-trans isomerase B (cyclophilin B)
MMRARTGLLFAALFVSGCDHRGASSPASSGAAVAQPDSAYTGQAPIYPRALPVKIPSMVASETNSIANPAAATPVVASVPAPVDVPPTVPSLTETSPPASAPVPDPSAPSGPGADTNTDMARLAINPTTPVVATNPPMAMDDDEARKQVVVLTTPQGRMVIELDDVSAPQTCGNFRKLVANGFYNHTTFHRVIPNLMIQGGDPNSKSDDRATYGQGDPGYTLPAEIKLKHTAGAVAMARLPDSVNPQRDSNGSQFFICVTTCPSLDDQYTVFGHVILGMDTAIKIANQARDGRDDPIERIEMEAILEPTDLCVTN